MARKENRKTNFNSNSEKREIKYPVPVFYNGNKVGEMNRRHIVKITDNSVTNDIISKIQSDPLVIETSKTGDKVTIGNGPEEEKMKMFQQRKVNRKKSKSNRWH